MFAHSSWFGMISELINSIKGNFLRKSSEQRTSTTFQDLPDEAVFLIFEFLNSTELVNVSSVCRRWNDLAFHYSVWVQRQVKATDIGGKQTLEKILSNSPVIHTLDLTRTTVEDSTIQTMLRSSIRIRNFKLYDCTCKADRQSINKVLLHLSGNLEALSFESYNDPRLYSNIFSLSMPNLRELTLIGDVNLSGINPDEFKLDFPLLESLKLSRFKIKTNFPTDPRKFSFIPDLTKKSRVKLRELHLPFCGDGRFLDALIQYDSLTTISLDLTDIPVVCHLPLIETLIIHCDWKTTPPSTWVRPKGLKILVLHLRRPTTDSFNFLRGIKAPSLTLISDNLCEELEIFCCESISRLTLRCHFLRLRHLCQTISREAAIPNLEYLDARKCFLGKGVPPKILADLKRSFPRLTVRSDRFVGYQKKRELRDNIVCTLGECTDCSDTE